MKPRQALCAALLAAGAGGCQLPWQKTGDIVRVDLHTTCTVLKTDPATKTQSLPVRVFLYEVSEKDPNDVKAVKARGALEFLMYPGRVTKAELNGAKPDRVLTFEPPRLEDHVIRTLVGWGYVMSLDVPYAGMVTVAVRYRPRDGAPLLSDPTTLPIGPK